MSRECAHTCCRNPATIRLRYHYEAAMVWLDDIGPAEERTPFELCAHHADRLRVPMGWQLDDRRAAAQPFFAPPAPPARLAG